MKTLKNILIGIPFGILALSLVILAIPFCIIILPISWIREKIYKKKYKEYLLTIEGKNFFCYNNRKKERKYIEEQIIPNLPEEVEIIFLNGKTIESDKYDSGHLSRAFYNFKNYTRFPQLLKIRNGEPVDISLNKEMFDCLNQGKSESNIFNKINSFFEL